MRASRPKSDNLAITTQFRSERGMVYEFEGFGSKLSIRITPRQSETDAGDWRIEAGATHDPTEGTIIAWGSTRADTLKRVAGMWKQEGPSRGLPDFDWNEVSRLLSTVAAL